MSDDLVERLRSQSTSPLTIFARAADEIERLRKGIQNYLDGDYGREKHFKTKHDTCPHGQFGWQACEACIDDYFKALLALPPAERGEGQ